MPAPELSEQSYLGTDDSQVSTSLPQQPINFSDEDNERNSSVDVRPFPVVLRRSGRVRKPVVWLYL